MAAAQPRRGHAGAAAADGPQIHDIPIGLTAAGTRRETDSMGAIDVPADKYWGIHLAAAIPGDRSG